jgi:hypothetical protein
MKNDLKEIRWESVDLINLLAPEIDIQILAHPVCKM